MAFPVRTENDLAVADESDRIADFVREWWQALRPLACEVRDVAIDFSTPKIRPTVELIAQANIQDLSEVMKQLVDLQRGPLEDHRGTLRPSTYAFECCVNLLVNAAITLNLDDSRGVPRGIVSPDFDGGLRIEWVRPTISVHLVIAADEDGPHYIYHEEGEDFGTDDEVTAERLASWLQLIRK